MITTYDDSPKFWQRTWFLALLVGIGAGVGVWWWQGHASPPSAAPQSADGAKSSQARKPDPDDNAELALLVPPTIGDDGRPSDFTPEEWSALKTAMAQTPNPRAELERVVKYLRFQKAFEQWQSLQESPDVLARRKLAEKLLVQIPERLAQSEVTGGEATLLQTALLADIEPNEALREVRLQQELEKLKASVPAPEVDLCFPEYKRREAAIVAAYQALPESRRDSVQLTRDLDAARVAACGGKN